MVTKVVTVDKDVGLDTKTYTRNSLPQYSPSRWPRTRTTDKYSVPLPTVRLAILLVKYPLAYIHRQRPTRQDILVKTIAIS